MAGDWTPSNEPSGYDPERVARLRPVADALAGLNLPPLRWRKLYGIFNALGMQIEDGGDSPAVNAKLVEALRAAVHHQASGQPAEAVLAALDAFEQAEAERWEQARAGTLPPPPQSDRERLAKLVQQVVETRSLDMPGKAIGPGLEAWELVKKLAPPDATSTDDFDAAFPELYDYVLTWCHDLEEDLDALGKDQPVWHERRLQFVREFLKQFPNEEEFTQIEFRDAEADALWQLGQREESERLAQQLVEEFPDSSGPYVAWAYRYNPDDADAPRDYERAEQILKSALERPELENDQWVLRELAELYHAWGKHDAEEEIRAKLPASDLGLGLPPLPTPPSQPGWALPQTFAPQQPAVVTKPGRNAPCWCGSGKKYKKCHLAADEAAGRQEATGG